MKSLLVVLIVTLCNQIIWTAGAPSSAEMPVRYDDAQLWKVEHTDLAKNILDELQRNSNGRFSKIPRKIYNNLMYSTSYRVQLQY